MIIWLLLVEQCFPCVKEPTNEVGKCAVAVVCTNSQCKEEVVGDVQEKFPWLYLCFYPCPIALCTYLQLGNASTMEVNMDWKSVRNFIFMDVKRPLNWLKNKILKIEENLSKTVKHAIKRCPL